MIKLITNSKKIFPDTYIRESSIEECLEYCNSLSIIGLDTETTGFFPMKGDKLLTIQMGNKSTQFIIDCTTISIEDIKKLQPLFMNKSKIFLGHNLKFDIRFFYQIGIHFNENLFDTFLAEYILYNGDKTIRKGLDIVSQRYLGFTISKDDRGLIHKEGLSTRVLQYCAKDIEFLEDIYNIQKELLIQKDLMQAIKLDNLFMEVLGYIEYSGIKLDVKKWQHKIENDKNELLKYENELNQFILENNINEFIDNTLFGKKVSINWNSSNQVIRLFKILNIPVEVDTNGDISETVGAKSIIKYSKLSPIIAIYINYKQSKKNCSTYGENFLEQVYNGRLYSSFNQLLDTGRTSCGGKDKNNDIELLNLQNIPRDEYTRSCFIPEEGNILIDIDYDGQEARMFANQCQDPVLLQMYSDGITDTHSYNAYNIFPHIREKYPIFSKDILKDIKTNFPKERYIAKTGGFATQYGGGPKAIAENCNISYEEAKKFYDNYFNTFKKVKEYFNKVKAKSKYDKYITMNPITRRKFFITESIPEWKVDSFCCNYPTQSTCADVSKYAGVLFFRQLKEKNLIFKVLIPLFLHDEYIVECPIDIADEISINIKDSMELAGKRFTTFPELTASPNICNHWTH